jgi:hypothetical protein
MSETLENKPEVIPFTLNAKPTWGGREFSETSVPRHWVSSPVSTVPKTSDTCCICFDDIVTSEHGYLNTKCCNHLLHSSCFITYAIKNKTQPNKCPMCRNDINTGKEYSESCVPEQILEASYTYSDEEYDEYDDYDPYGFHHDEYGNSDSESEIDTIPPANIPFSEWFKSRSEKPDKQCTVSLDILKSTSDIGLANYKDDTWQCLALYNSATTALTVHTINNLTGFMTERKFICGDIPRLVSINLTPNAYQIYVIISYPDDGECHKLLFYFPLYNTVIMGAFTDTEYPLDMYDNGLIISKFSDHVQKYGTPFVYVSDQESCNTFRIEVIELDRLQTLFQFN